MRDGEDERQAVFAKLADPKHFSGSHRTHFDSSTGNGKGLTDDRLDDHERLGGEALRLDRSRQTPRALADSGRSKSPATKRRARTPQKRLAHQTAPPAAA